MTLTINSQQLWFTSDTHLGHRNVIKYCNRPFSSVDEMDETIIRNINEKVPENAYLFHVGDVSFYPEEKTIEMLARINCRNIYLIGGNHDKNTVKNKVRHRFIQMHNLLEIDAQEGPDQYQRITLCHYAMRVWNKSHYGAWQLYGHSHGSLPDDPGLLSIDVGIDVHRFAPVSFQEVKAIMAKKTWKPIDHHGTRLGDDGKVY